MTVQPFDPGYDYGADRPVDERMMSVDIISIFAAGAETATKVHDLLREGAREIRALRRLVHNLSVRIDELSAELENQHEE